jgi:GNAT superfamily N-acetyltransferase
MGFQFDLKKSLEGFDPKEAESTAKNNIKQALQALTDNVYRGGVAGLAGSPMDMTNMLGNALRTGSNQALGTDFKQVENPIGGSEWIGQQLQNAGIVSPTRRPIGELLAGLADPATMGAAAVKGAAMIPKIANIDDVSKAAKALGVDVRLFESGDAINLSKIVVPKESRNKGIGSEAMRIITDYADSSGKRIDLTPSEDFGGSKKRLEGFYKNLGFESNSGKNKDYSISESMYRSPISTNKATILNRLQDAATAAKLDPSQIKVADNVIHYPDEWINTLLGDVRGDVASHNATEMLGLPTDASRMERAAAGGFDTGMPLYHGTGADIKAFDQRLAGKNDGGLWGRGQYLATSPESASRYAFFEGSGENVIPAYVAVERPMRLTTGSDLVTRMPDGTNTRDLVGYNLDGYKIKEIAQAAGHDGVFQFKPDGNVGDIVTYDPSAIRSRFAAFDPAKKDSSNLLASLLAGTIVGKVATEKSKNNKDKKL